jgi:hypothetical protein
MRYFTIRRRTERARAGTSVYVPMAVTHLGSWGRADPAGATEPPAGAAPGDDLAPHTAGALHAIPLRPPGNDQRAHASRSGFGESSPRPRQHNARIVAQNKKVSLNIFCRSHHVLLVWSPAGAPPANTPTRQCLEGEAGLGNEGIGVERVRQRKAVHNRRARRRRGELIHPLRAASP